MQNQSNFENDNTNNLNIDDSKKVIKKCKSFFVYRIFIALIVIAGLVSLFFYNNNFLISIFSEMNDKKIENNNLSKDKALTHKSVCSAVFELSLIVVELYNNIISNNCNFQSLSYLQEFFNKNADLFDLEYRKKIIGLIDRINTIKESKYINVLKILVELENVLTLIPEYSVDEKKFFDFLKIKKVQKNEKNINIQKKITFYIDEIKNKNLSIAEIYKQINNDSEIDEYAKYIKDEIAKAYEAIEYLRLFYLDTKDKSLYCISQYNNIYNELLNKEDTNVDN